MLLNLELAQIEVDALNSERTSDAESVTAVIHRLIIPLVERLLNQKFTDLLTHYVSLPVTVRAEVIGSLEDLRKVIDTQMATTTPATVVPSPSPVVEPVPVTSSTSTTGR